MLRRYDAQYAVRHKRYAFIYLYIYKVFRSAGGIRRPLRLLRKEKQCEVDKKKTHA